MPYRRAIRSATHAFWALVAVVALLVVVTWLGGYLGQVQATHEARVACAARTTVDLQAGLAWRELAGALRTLDRQGAALAADEAAGGFFRRAAVPCEARYPDPPLFPSPSLLGGP